MRLLAEIHLGWGWVHKQRASGSCSGGERAGSWEAWAASWPPKCGLYCRAILFTTKGWHTIGLLCNLAVLWCHNLADVIRTHRTHKEGSLFLSSASASPSHRLPRIRKARGYRWCCPWWPHRVWEEVLHLGIGEAFNYRTQNRSQFEAGGGRWDRGCETVLDNEEAVGRVCMCVCRRDCGG